MNKDELLRKVNIEGKGLDEREQRVYFSSFGLGYISVVVLCFIFAVINGIKGQGYMEFIIIIFASQSVTDFYKYKHLNNSKVSLITSIAEGLVAIISLIFFIIKG